LPFRREGGSSQRLNSAQRLDSGLAGNVNY
jgi:hypothetical protein